MLFCYQKRYLTISVVHFLFPQPQTLTIRLFLLTKLCINLTFLSFNFFGRNKNFWKYYSRIFCYRNYSILNTYSIFIHIKNLFFYIIH